MLSKIIYQIKSFTKVFFLGLAFTISILSGCGTCGWFGVNGCDEFEKGAVPAPAGSKVAQWEVIQVARAMEDQTSLYQADFIGSTAALSPSAKEKMARAISSGLSSQKWIVQPTENLQLNRLRLIQVTGQLEMMGLVDPIVEISDPTAIGLPGPLAESAISNSGRIGSRTTAIR